MNTDRATNPDVKTFKLNNNTIKFEMYKPDEIKRMVISYLIGSLVPLLLIFIVPPRNVYLLKFELIILIPYVFVSAIVYIFSAKLINEYFLYSAASFFVNALTWLMVSLKLMKLLSPIPIIIASFILIGIITVTYIKRIPIAVYINNSSGKTVAYPALGASLGVVLAGILSKFLPKTVILLIVGVIFLSLAYVFSAFIIYNMQKWRLLRNN